ncbi:hypothetical protein B1964_06995, partial [Gordonia sp. i37]
MVVMGTDTTPAAAGSSGSSTSGTQGSYVTGGQEFVRDTKYIETRITRDGRDGYPVEAGRYRLPPPPP